MRKVFSRRSRRALIVAVLAGTTWAIVGMPAASQSAAVCPRSGPSAKMVSACTLAVPGNQMAGTIKAKASVTIAANAVGPVTVTLVSYTKPLPAQTVTYPQMMYVSKSVVVNAGESAKLMTAVPLCGSYQVDLVVGDVFPTIQTRADGYAAKGKLLAAMIGPSEAKMMECGGKVTGGGFFDRNLSNDTDEDTDSFGFVAMQDAGDAAGKGHLNIIDHETGDHIQGWTVKNLIVNPAHTFARWSGRATFNGVDTTFTVEVQDLGEPGRDDTFKVVLGNGYTASGVLGDGGNIQIHKN